MTYTISAQDRKGSHAVPLAQRNVARFAACKAAWLFSQQATLCDVVVTRGKKHIATYRQGYLTHYEGKDHKP